MTLIIPEGPGLGYLRGYETFRRFVMDDLRIRPKGPYIFEADWKELYVLNEHWASDLAFYGDDLTFLHHLLKSYYMWLFLQERADQGSKVAKQLEELESRRNALARQTQKNLAHLAGLIDDPFRYDSHKFRNEHAALEEEIAHFVKDFRACKKDAFALSKRLVSSEEFLQQVNS